MEGPSSVVTAGGGKAAGESVEGEKKLREFLKESMIRNVLQEMVNPLIAGQKKNQADVNKVMEELKAIQAIHESSMKVITDTQA